MAAAFTLTGLVGNAIFPGRVQDYLQFLTVFVTTLVLLAIGNEFYVSDKREKDLKQLAPSAGLAFDADAEKTSYLGWGGLDLFHPDHYRKSRNLLISSGAGAEKVYFFDYAHMAHSLPGLGGYGYTAVYTVAFFGFSKSVFPRFALGPKNFLDKIGGLRGLQEINIDGFPVFLKEYTLNGPEKAAVLAFFNPRVVNYFEQNLDWCVQACDDRILVFKKETVVPAAYQTFMEEAKNLVSTIVGK